MDTKSSDPANTASEAPIAKGVDKIRRKSRSTKRMHRSGMSWEIFITTPGQSMKPCMLLRWPLNWIQTMDGRITTWPRSTSIKSAMPMQFLYIKRGFNYE